MNPDNVRVTSGRDSNYKSSDVKGRPTAEPESTKDFKKILDKDAGEKDEDAASKEIIEETDGLIVAMTQDTKKKAPTSLFDLTAAQKSPRLAVKTDQPDVPVAAPTIDDKVVGDIKPVKEKPVETDDADIKVDVETVPVTPVEKDRFTTRFSTEQTDLSYVNPLAATANQQPSVNLNISNEKLIVPVKSIQDIINQMVANVTEMKAAGKTDTEVTLRYPPLFEGAKVIVTSFDNAKNEFNIAIENLTQEAKNLMDLKINRDNLLLALEQRGYAVHIFATTTVAENRVTPPPPDQQFGRQREQEGQQQGSQQQQRGRGERQA